MHVVARDGMPLGSAEYDCDTLGVNPGERHDVLVTAKTLGVWAFHCHILPHAEGMAGMFGMVNTLVLSVFERTRELGMLRAVGMTRRQTRRMIRHESVITALIGAALGLPLGIFLAVLVTRALSEFDVRFSVPTGQIIVLVVLAVIVGLLAAITPARRAAKLNPLEALHYE